MSNPHVPTTVTSLRHAQLGCKIRVKDHTGRPACERQAQEQDVTRIFGRKRRIDATASGTLRNGIGVAKPGDKRYSHPDYAPGFFKGGGVYPGSNWGFVMLAESIIIGNTALAPFTSPLLLVFLWLPAAIRNP